MDDHRQADTGTAARAVLLALADQRLPTGGHVHSGGVEQAVDDHVVHDEESLCAYLRERLASNGLVTAALAAAAARVTHAELGELDAEADARMPSPSTRSASRAQGRGLLRLASRAWAAPAPDIAWSALGDRPHHPVVVGLAARAAGLTARDAALVAAYLAMTGPSTAAQRLLGLDPIGLAVATFGLADVVEEVASLADRAAAQQRLRDLPDLASPLVDLLVERHAHRTDRLFAS